MSTTQIAGTSIEVVDDDIKTEALSILVLALLFAQHAGGGLARNPKPRVRTNGRQPTIALLEVDSSHQGLLLEGGEPLNGGRSMVFRTPQKSVPFLSDNDCLPP